MFYYDSTIHRGQPLDKKRVVFYIEEKSDNIVRWILYVEFKTKRLTE